MGVKKPARRYDARVPSVVTLLLHPERRRPDPASWRVDLRVVILAGMALWTVALVVCAVLLATGTLAPRAVATCAVGLALGALGLGWERRNRTRYRASADD
ncbi:Protein of unknown function [Cellulosimicrobium aquatile]|uniref:DUF2530 domain-containing protein n=1 Tax=Cellulosimicrobium aquatile TaxID=1612203 RepID=A0A1N6V4C1_9MICO|nr:Protein of unknown function [Cellulosimicrobium aquatile]